MNSQKCSKRESYFNHKSLIIEVKKFVSPQVLNQTDQVLPGSRGECVERGRQLVSNWQVTE